MVAGGVAEVPTTFNFKNNLALSNPKHKFFLLLFLLFSFWSLLVRSLGRPCVNPRPFVGKINVANTTDNGQGRGVDLVDTNYNKVNDSKLTDMCHIVNMSVYVYDLPSKFNSDLLRDCTQLNRYGNMCPHVVNHCLGQPLSNDEEPSSSSTKDAIWFATNQFTAEQIFHARMENHPCRTMDPERATLFYVPFYGGFHMSSRTQEANHTVRDELAVQLAEHVRHQQPWWGRRDGKDHFMVLGRTVWDFMRPDPIDHHRGLDYGPNTLLNLPTVRNMSVFAIERHPWEGRNQHGIPYPSYFHPYNVDQVKDWQRKVAGSNRPYLFTYIGARRKDDAPAAAIRDELMRQCSESRHCMLLNCTAEAPSKCNVPTVVMRAMTASRFCLQPRGDSFTRRSLFDSVLAGCVPVVFSRHTAYTQYEMFLPRNASSYSVFVGEDEILSGGSRKVKIEDELMKIGSGEVEEMRNVVVGLIPRLTFAHPNAGGEKGFEDVVDVALSSLLRQVHY